MKNKTKNNLNKKIDFAIGGQAVIEGVMMRSPNSIVISVRDSKGRIIVQDRFYKTLIQRLRFLNVPILRGMINLIEMMIIGGKAINFSANIQMRDDDPGKKNVSENFQKSFPQKLFEFAMFLFSLTAAIAISIFLFKFLPLWITTFLEKKSTAIQDNYMIFNLIDGIIKTSFFILYIWILSLLPSFKRIFEYHGAEHKAVFAYEKSLSLTIENARKQSRFHPRCGTSFILIVFVISILVYTFIPRMPDFGSNFGLRLALLPFVAGIAYEYLKVSAKYAEKSWTKIFVAPGLWMQRLTTREPDDEQLEVALNSLKIALNKERGKNISNNL